MGTSKQLPTSTYRGECPETGQYIEVETPCPRGWSIVQLAVYGIVFKRDRDGLVARHTIDDRAAGRDPQHKLTIDGETVLSGDVSKSDAVEYLSQL